METDYVGYLGCRDFDPPHSICAEESLLPCSAIVDSEPDLVSAACTSDIRPPGAHNAETAEIVVCVDEQHRVAGIAGTQYILRTLRPQIAPPVRRT
ncbi:hypothetical protein GCM10023319_19830 [Nocardia iowensis]